MCKNFKKVFWPGLGAGVAILVIGMGVSFLMNAIFPSLMAQYENTALYRAWDDPIMSLFFVAPLVIGFVLAAIWDHVKKLFKGTCWCRGFHFGLWFFLLAIPGMLYTYSSFQVSLGATLSWTFLNLVNGVVGGVVLAKLNK